MHGEVFNTSRKINGTLTLSPSLISSWPILQYYFTRSRRRTRCAAFYHRVVLCRYHHFNPPLRTYITLIAYLSLSRLRYVPEQLLCNSYILCYLWLMSSCSVEEPHCRLRTAPENVSDALALISLGSANCVRNTCS